MNTDEVRGAIEGMGHVDRLVLFESLTDLMNKLPSKHVAAYRSALFPTRRVTRHADAVEEVRKFIRREGYITLYHAKVNDLVPSSIDSATWKRCYIEVLEAEENLTVHTKRYRPVGHRGKGQKVYTLGGYTPSFLKSHNLPYSLLTEQERAAGFFVERVLAMPRIMARGFPKKAQIVEDFQAIKVSGSPVFTDLDAASIITWLDVFVKPVLERKKKSDPRYARYSIHNGKVMLLTQSGQTLQEEE